MKKCPKCGKTYDDTWKVCLHCRQGLVPHSGEESGGNTPHSDGVLSEMIGHIFLYILGILILGGVIYSIVRFVKWAWMR